MHKETRRVSDSMNLMLVRYSGVLASSSRLRRRIIPADPEKSAAESPACTHAKKPALSVDKSNALRGLHERRYAWAELLKRVYAVDALSASLTP
jgi:hypothetical protein